MSYDDQGPPPFSPPTGPPHAPGHEDGWNRAGWDMSDLEKYGSRGAAGRGHRAQHHDAKPTPWLTFVTVLSGIFVLTGGFNFVYGVLILITGRAESPARLVVELGFSAFMTWAYFGVAMHRHSARKIAMGWAVFQLFCCVIAAFGVFILGFFSVALAAVLGAALLLSAGLTGVYVYALQRYDVAAHFTE